MRNNDNLPTGRICPAPPLIKPAFKRDSRGHQFRMVGKLLIFASTASPLNPVNSARSTGTNQDEIFGSTVLSASTHKKRRIGISPYALRNKSLPPADLCRAGTQKNKQSGFKADFSLHFSSPFIHRYRSKIDIHASPYETSRRAAIQNEYVVGCILFVLLQWVPKSCQSRSGVFSVVTRACSEARSAYGIIKSQAAPFPINKDSFPNAVKSISFTNVELSPIFQ